MPAENARPLPEMNAWVEAALPKVGFDDLRKAIVALAHKVPLTDGILFECHDTGEVDVSLRLSGTEATAEPFAARFRELAPEVDAHPVWRTLLTRVVGPDLGTMWLEFDRAQIDAPVPVPGVFWQPRKARALAGEIAGFGCGRISAERAQHLAQRVARYPEPDFLGVMLSRPGGGLRLCCRMPVRDLSTIDLPLSAAQIAQVERSAGEHPVMLSFDLDPEIQSRIGVEFDLSDPAVRSADAARGWAAAAPDLSDMLAETTPVPLPGQGQLAWVRRANHRKLVFDGSGEAVAKVYLYLGVGWAR